MVRIYNIKKVIKTVIVSIIMISVTIVSVKCSPKRSKLPILVLATNSGFGTYTAEILKAEGFNEFILDSLNDVKLTPSYIQQFDVVILAESVIRPDTKKLLRDYVNYGGSLIAFMPDKELDELFGITSTEETFREGYVKTNPSSIQSVGVAPELLQFHGIAAKYKLNGGEIIATLFDDKSSSESFPGVVSNKYGKGYSIAFLYNLPQSIVYTRQGNPLSAGIEKDGIHGLRGMDLFTDGWIDTTLNTVNQADQQMALLTNCIQSFSENIKPIPRFWYFPDTFKCLAVLDNDGEYKSETDFETQFRDIDNKEAKMTIYILDVEKVSKEWVDKWTAKGFEIAAHPDDTKNAANPTWNDMDSALTCKIGMIKDKFSIDVRTNANHWFVWCGNDENGKQDFAAQAKLEEKHGIEMNANYAHYDINSNQPKNYLGTLGYNQGNYTGSGMVMKYADASGKTVNVYQRFNAVYDQQYNEGSDTEKFFECFKGLVDRSLYDDIYSVVSIKSHNDEYYFSKEPLMKMLDYANEKGVPVWTALHLLDFSKMKDEASFSDILWKGNGLSFTLNSSLKHSNGLTFMVPAMYEGQKVESVTKDKQKATFSIQKVRGLEYAFVTVQGGSNYCINVRYQ